MNRTIGRRTSVVHTVRGPEIHIRARYQWWPLIFLPVWFVGWTFGGIMALRQMFIEPQPFLAFSLMGWLVGELFVAFAWSWTAFGEEVISVGQRHLSVARRIGPWQVQRRYALHECKGLRAAGWFGSPMSFSDSLRMWGLTGGTVAVDCSGKPIRFGINLEEGDAKAVVRELEPFVEAAQR